MRRLLFALLVFVLVAAGTAGWVVLTEPRTRASAGWERLADMPTARGEVAAAVVEAGGGNHVVVVGGFAGLGRVSDEVHVLDPRAGTWRRGPGLPAGRHHAAAAGLDGDVYVSGGASSPQSSVGTSDLWVLRAGTSSWAALEPMPEGRFGHRMVAVDGLLYVVGGVGATERVLAYEPGAGWRAAAELPTPRDHLGAVVVDGEIWAVGGRHEGSLSARVDVYDPAGDTWREGPRLPSPVSAAAVGLVDGVVSVVGGEDPAPLSGWVSSRHWRLDPASERWQPGPRPLLGVHGAGDAVVDGRLIVVGGAGRQGPWSVLSWSSLVQVYAGG